MLKYSEFSLQILDRKNDEIDVLKSAYIKKQKESEDTIRKLEKKGDFYPHGCLCVVALYCILLWLWACAFLLQTSLPSSFAALDLIFSFRF